MDTLADSVRLLVHGRISTSGGISSLTTISPVSEIASVGRYWCTILWARQPYRQHVRGNEQKKDKHTRSS